MRGIISPFPHPMHPTRVEKRFRADDHDERDHGTGVPCPVLKGSNEAADNTAHRETPAIPAVNKGPEGVPGKVS